MLKTAWRVLGRYGGEDAEDVVQESWIAAWSTDATPTGDVGAWLRAIAARKALDRTRSRGRRAEVALPDPHHETRGRTESPDGSYAERDAVRRALAELKPIDRAVLLLIDLEGRTAAEAADVLGVTRVAAKLRVQRARKRLVRSLEALALRDRFPVSDRPKETTGDSNV